MIDVVGLGPGAAEHLTHLAAQRVAECDWLVGAERQLATFSDFRGQRHLLDKKLTDLLAWLQQHSTEKVVVLASGDPMLYGIGKFLTEQLGAQQVRVIPGISSIQYLFARVGLDLNGVYLTSSHGKALDFDVVFRLDKVALVTDQQMGPYQIAQASLARGFRKIMIIGENLSYPNERIQRLAAADVADIHYDMNAMIILNE